MMKMMKKRTLNIIICLCLALTLTSGIYFPCFAVESADISHNPHVLFLDSYSYEWESVPRHLEGITKTLNGSATVDYVFMDTKRLDYEDVKARIYYDIYSRELDEAYDYIIAADDAALQFVLEYREELFAGIPVVFEGINDVDYAYSAAEDPLITGIVETFPLEDTIRLAMSINPDATKVVGITDDSVSGQGSTKQFFDCQQSIKGLSFETLNCSELTCGEIGSAVAAYGDDTILIFLMMTSDAEGNIFSNTEATEFITANARIPVYKADELGVGSGVLGGVVVSYSDMASDAAKITLELERGADIKDYPVQTAKSYCVFDKAVMNGFGIKKSRVASAYDGDIMYINDRPSFFKVHKNVLIPAGIIIVMLAAFSSLTVLILRNKKKLMTQLEDKERMLNSLLDNIPGGLAIYRIRAAEQHSIDTVYSSQGVPRLSGRTMEEYSEWIKGSLFENTVYEGDLSRLAALVSECVPERKPIYMQYHLKCKDGSLAFISLSAVWAYDEPDGSHIYYAVYLDMAQQEKAQQAEREAMEAKASNAAKSRFLSHMSHDIRTPLNAVLGFTGLALDEPEISPVVADYLNKISSSGRYLLNLINDVLDMARIESGKIELHEESVNEPRLVSVIAEIFRAQAEEKGIAFVTDFTEAKTEWVMMDELRTRQIYANLLSNAIKFSQSGTTVRWTISETENGEGGTHMRCTVSDQGCGMSEEFMAKMFLPFEQDDPVNAANGTGLGLPIVWNLVTLMGGTIRAESEPGKGTTFILELDRRVGEPQKEAEKKKGVPAEILAGRRILLCEDNKINIAVALKLLEKAGCLTDVAENGRICVDMFEASPPETYAAILMDIQMPVMDGLEASRTIRALGRQDAAVIPIIAMSANAFTEDVKSSLEAGINAHLSKPIDPQTLYKTLSKQIGSNKSFA